MCDKMYFNAFLCVLLSGVISCDAGSLNPLQSGANKTFIYNTYKYDTPIYITVNDSVVQFMDFYEDTDLFHGFPTRVHVSTNDTIAGEHPLFITAVQQKGVTSWQLPLVVATKSAELKFDDVSRTLCPHDAGPNVTSVNRPSLQVSTSSAVNVTASIKLRRVNDFYLQVDKEVNLTVKPSTPKYYYFSFDSTPQNVSVGNQLKMIPRFNYTIPKSVILIIESDDDICATVSIQNNSCPVFDNERDVLYQGYHLTMTTKGGITLTQSMFPQGFYVVFIVRENDDACTGDSFNARSVSRLKTFRFRIIATISYKEYVVGALLTLALVVLVALLVALLPLCSSRCTETVEIVDEPGPSTSRDQVGSSDEPKTSKMDDDSDLSDSIPEWEGSLTRPLTVAGLCRARPAAHSRRSDRYFWSSLTVAVVYALPVVQLLITYQRDTGIPQHSGLFYSLGLALAMEGLLSACYHLCPNKMNFQFDSSFMYVIAVICMVKLYQSRHADVNAGAHATFMLIAVVMALGVFGIIYPSVYYWALFTILHLGTCLVLTLKIYYVGQFKLERAVFARGYGKVRALGRHALVPDYTARALLLALANAANWALAIYGLYEHNKDFARHLLAILMGNTFLYTMFYVIMKLAHRERLRVATWLFLVGTFVMWTLAALFFLRSRTKWSQTPAQSRQHNAVCSVLQFYDSHDVWHFASAVAMFLYFNMLLTIDDPLKHTPRDQIPVF